MRGAFIALAIGLGLSVGSQAIAIAADRTVTLAVQNMYCATCPYTVKASLQAVPGVERVVVSMEQRTATVTYDDAQTDVDALTAATTKAGYPSAPKG